MSGTNGDLVIIMIEHERDQEEVQWPPHALTGRDFSSCLS